MSERRGRILRVGVVRDGGLVSERLVPAGEAVTVGDGTKGTLSVPELPAGFRLFEPTAEGYVLRCTERVVGRISRGGAIVHVRAEDARVALTDQDRGKLQVGSTTVLFQHVDPPRSRPVGPVRPGEFRPRVLQEGDPLFMGFFGVWSALGVVLAILAWGTEPAAPTLETRPRSVARLLVPRAPAPPPPTPVVAPAPPSEAPPLRARQTASSPTPTPGPAPSARGKEELVRSSPILVAILGTNGRSERFVKGLLSDPGLGATKEALQHATSATQDPAALTRTGRASGTEAAEGEIGLLGGGETGSLEVTVTVKASVAPGAGSVAGTGDADLIKATVAEGARHLRYCYEQRLKAAPNLEGRLEVAWSVANGRVVGAPYVVADTSGDPALAECVTKRIRGWTFPEGVEGDVSWPFVFQRKP